MHYNGLTHNGITIDSYFVSTKHRYGALIGGWWYSAILDLESIRLLGRCILGDKNGNLLSVGGNVPNTLNLWLKANAGNNPFEEYSIWSNIMNCIGERKFIKKSINKDELYKKIGGK